jgi:TonB family protein
MLRFLDFWAVSVLLVLQGTEQAQSSPSKTSETQITTNGAVGRTGKAPSSAGSSSATKLVQEGDSYRLGNGVPQDEAQAATLYKRAATGSAEGKTLYAEALFEGRGVDKNQATAQALLEAAADQQNARAETDLGIMLLDGDMVAEDFPKAREWLQRGANHGDALAENYLGLLAEYGFFGERSASQAYEHYLKAAQEGSVWGAFNVGRAYRDGMSVKRDSVEALEWFQRAASTTSPEALYQWGRLHSEAGGIDDAMFAVGDIYGEGLGVPENKKEAGTWYGRGVGLERSAALAGWPLAQVSLGQHLEQGRGVAQDQSEAKQWYLKAAAQGERTAEVQLGLLCIGEGHAIPPSYTEALWWFRKAADHGSHSAQLRIGTLYRLGLGVPEDHKEALTWVLKATADPEDTLAIYTVGLIYDMGGFGVERDYAHAMKWYEIAEGKGEPYALCAIGDMYAKGHGVEQNYVVAMDWYNKAADLGSPWAYERIGTMYAHGTGVAKDLLSARAWFQKAADQNWEPGKGRIVWLTETAYPLEVEVLSPTIGTDFGPYLERVTTAIRQSWHASISGPAEWKKGKLSIEFGILKDGKVTQPRLLEPSGDAALDSAAWSGIRTLNPFPPLPPEFSGSELKLRMNFSYYVDLNDDRTHSAGDIQTKSSKDNSDAAFEISPAGALKIKAGSAQQFFAYTKAVAWAIKGDQCTKEDCGRMSTSGFYLAPNAVPTPTDFTLTATQIAAPFETVVAPVTIVGPTGSTERRNEYPGSQGWVSDFANVLDPKAKASLSGLCSELSLKAHAQIKVVAIGSTKPTQLADYAYGMMEEWGIGQAYDDKGILIILAVSDRNWRIEVGPGLRTVLPDDRAADIGHEMVPDLRQEKYSEALLRAAREVAEIIAADSHVKLSATR